MKQQQVIQPKALLRSLVGVGVVSACMLSAGVSHAQFGALTGSIPLIGGGGLPVIGGLLGGSAGGTGGLPIVGGLPIIGGSTGGLPIIGSIPVIGGIGGGGSTGGLLGSLPIIGGLLGGSSGGLLGSLPVVGGLGGTGGLPVIGSLPVIGGLGGTTGGSTGGGGLIGSLLLSAGSMQKNLAGVTGSLPLLGPIFGVVGAGGQVQSSNSARAAEAVHKVTGQTIANGAVILAWTGDDVVDDGKTFSDFLAVIDAEPMSKTYGKVIHSANLPVYAGASNPGTALGHTSDVHNDPHHNSAYTTYINPDTGRKYLFAGGVISANIFRYDITDVRAIPTADLAVCGNELLLSSLTDDFMELPNGHIAVTYMGGKSYYGPGTVTEFAPMRKAVCAGGTPYLPLVPVVLQDNTQFLRENTAIKLGTGIQRYTPQRLTGNTDVGLEAYPHGMQLTYDGAFLVTSDYSNPALLGAGVPVERALNQAGLRGILAPASTAISQYGTTVRVWRADNLTGGPVSVSQMPNGPRHEEVYLHDEPEGIMAFGMPHQPYHIDAVTGQQVPHDGAFGAAMCGGTLFYTSNIRETQAANGGQGPKWKAVYDVGPCAGVSYFGISENDKFMYLPISGIQSPGDPEYNRDYPGEHDRRMLVLDIRPLLKKGTGPINCDYPPADPSAPSGSALGKQPALGKFAPGQPLNNALNNRIHNNGADDCPVLLSQLTNNSAMNYSGHGGAHFTLVDRAGTKTSPAGAGLKPNRRFMFMDYFVNLDHMALDGTGSDGDRKVYMVNTDPNTGVTSYDMNFRDELTGEVGLAFTSPQRSKWSWPNRGVTGNAKPHAGIFEANDLKGAKAMKGPHNIARGVEDYDTVYGEFADPVY